MRAAIPFLKNISLKFLRQRLLALYTLNLADIALTLFLLGTGCFTEANPIIAPAAGSAPAALALKAVLPAALVAFVFVRLKTASDSQLKSANVIISLAVLFYAAVDIMHLFWVSAYFVSF